MKEWQIAEQELKVSRLLLNTEQQDVWLQRKVLGIAPNHTTPNIK